MVLERLVNCNACIEIKSPGIRESKILNLGAMQLISGCMTKADSFVKMSAGFPFIP